MLRGPVVQEPQSNSFDVVVSQLPQGQGSVASTALWVTSHAAEDVAAAAQVAPPMHSCVDM